MGLFSFVGKALNDLTGASSAQRKAQKYNQSNMATSQNYTMEQMAKNQQYALKQMAKNFEYEKIAANSAHQWAMADLEKAGLNPILAATNEANLSGSVAGGSVSGGASTPSAPAPSSGIDIITALSSAKQMLASANLAESQRQVAESQIGVNKANALKAETEAGLMPASAKAQIRKMNAETAYTNGPLTWETNERGWKYIHENQKNDAERDYTKRRASGKSIGISRLNVHW